MRNTSIWIAAVASLCAACQGTQVARLPLAPGAPLPAAPAPAGPVYSERFTVIAVGQSITLRGTATDPECVGVPGYQCHNFRLTAPAEGILEIVLESAFDSPIQMLDLSLMYPTGLRSWAMDNPLKISAAVKADVTYEVTIWYVTPNTAFALRTALR